jgi:hypothetical protein
MAESERTPYSVLRAWHENEGAPKGGMDLVTFVRAESVEAASKIAAVRAAAFAGERGKPLAPGAFAEQTMIVFEGGMGDWGLYAGHLHTIAALKDEADERKQAGLPPLPTARELEGRKRAPTMAETLAQSKGRATAKEAIPSKDLDLER